ncbi:MAG: ABC transporter substrate-binding protein [Zestosphaera sp.]
MNTLLKLGISRLYVAIIAFIVVVAAVATVIFITTPTPTPTSTPTPTPTTPKPTTPTPTPTPTTTPTTPKPTPTPTPTTTPVGERLLRFSNANVPNLDPAVGSDEASAIYFINVYDTLVYPLPNGTIIPHAAERWTVSADGLTWTFYIRKGIKFHVTGRELTAHDVEFSLRRLFTIGRGYAYLFTPIVDINKTKVVDNYTIQITLKSTFGPFLQILVRLFILDSELVKQHIKTPGPYGALGDYGTEWLAEGSADAGSGAYMLAEYRRGESVVLRRNVNWWGKFAPNAPDRVIMLGTTEPTTILTLMSKRELEITDTWQSIENYEAMSRIKGINLTTIPTLRGFYFMLNTQKPPLDDIHVRKAISLAFDYEAAIEGINPYQKRGLGPVPSSLAGFCQPPEILKRNVQAAIEELKKSKYWGSLDKYPIDVWWVAEVPWEERAALLFKANLEEIGLKVNVIKQPWLSVIQGLSTLESSPHAVTVINSADYAEAGAMLMKRYHSSSYGKYYQNEWLFIPELDKMIEDAISTINFNERLSKYCKIQHYIFNLYPTLYVYDYVDLRAYQAYYVDFPAARGEVAPLVGYQLECRWIQVYPEKRAELLG